MGLDVFKTEVEKLLGYNLQPARAYAFDRNVDDFGWVKGQNGKYHFTLFIENGRIQDEPGKDFKTGMKEIAKIHKGAFRLTANQHIIITDVDNGDLPLIKQLLAKYKLDNLSQSGLRLSSSACVAFPTCGESFRPLKDASIHLLDRVGLAMAESERVRTDNHYLLTRRG
jgi:sulfite reductase (NADPH) hemoprotein beta-component